jgi:hypothetical protein
LCHSILKYPDTYDYDYDSEGAGNFDIMSGGPNDCNPLPINPYMRTKLSNFGTAHSLNNVLPGTTISLTPNSLDTYIFNNPSNSKEYYMIESINKLELGSRREEMPGSGLLVWHIDENGDQRNQQMTATSHYVVSVVQADGLYHLENNANAGHQEDFFYAGNKDFFTPESSPSSTWWDGTWPTLCIRNINAAGTQFKLYTPPANFRITNSVNLAVQFSWNAAVTGSRYAIYRKYHGTTGDPVKVTETVNTAEVVFTPYGSYDYFIAIVNSAGNRISSFSPPVNVEAYVDAPSNFSITKIGRLTCRVQLNAVQLGSEAAMHYTENITEQLAIL